MGEHCGLGCGRRAAREQQHRGELGGAGELEGFVAGALDPIGRGDDGGLESFEHRPQLIVGQPEVERGIRDACPRGPEQCRGNERREWLHQRHRAHVRVVGTHPTSDRVRGAAQVGVREPVVAVAERDAVAERVGRHLEDHGDVHGVPP